MFMMPMAPTKSARPVTNRPATAMPLLIGSSVLRTASWALTEKSSFCSGLRPRMRRMSPMTSSREASRRFLSFIFTRIDVSRRELNVFWNAASGTTA